MTLARGARTAWLALVVAASTFDASAAEAQDDNESEARRLLETGQEHYDARRYAEAASAYMQAYEVMRAAAHRRASLALWNAGRAMSFVSGRECEARDTLQRFMRESHALADDEVVSDDRSQASALIPQLESRGHCEGEERSGRGTQPTPRPEPGIHPVGPIVLGIGGAALVGGIITGSVAMAGGSALRERCGSLVCPPEELGNVASVRALSNATDALLFGGAAIAVAGLVLTLVLREEAPGSVACGPSGCALRGTF